MNKMLSKRHGKIEMSIRVDKKLNRECAKSNTYQELESEEEPME